jgi:propanediol utilization protein
MGVEYSYKIAMEDCKMAKEVLVEVSARHVHVSQEALETLFGKGFGNYPQDIRMRMHYAVN